jgi:SAM-dependent methyltransferase
MLKILPASALRAFRQIKAHLKQNEVAPSSAPMAPGASFSLDLLKQLRSMHAPDFCEQSPVSDALIARLDLGQISAIEAIATGEELAVLRGAKLKDQGWVRLAIAVHHGMHDVIAAAGLSAANPPITVHSMSRSWLGAGGSYGHADMIIDALAASGVTEFHRLSGLDFGCSSGRILRVLRARYPSTTWYGCDPNHDAIAWASNELPGIRFFPSNSNPPLALGNASIDFAFAISIWSHFGASAANRWFAELQRIIKPGGHLLFSTHGWHSLKHYGSTQERSETQLAEIACSLIRGEHWYAAEFGEAGDHGVLDSEWGTGFFDLRWLSRTVCSNWRITAFYPGRECGNQDVYVMQRLATN